MSTVRAWIAENKILLLGTLLSTLLLELHLVSYHTDPHVEEALNAVVIVATSSGTGTGFYFSPDCMLTAAHVVMDAKGAKPNLTVRLRGELMSHPATLVSANLQMDMAILCSSSAVASNWLKIANTESIRRGDAVYALGHTYGRTWNTTDGVVSRTGYKMHTGDGKAWFPRYNLWVSAFISWGNSGGPVIDKNGNVVGMIVEWDDPGTHAPSNMNIAIPGTDLLRFIRAANGR